MDTAGRALAQGNRQFGRVAQLRHAGGGGTGQVEMRADDDLIGADSGGARRAQTAAKRRTAALVASI